MNEPEIQSLIRSVGHLQNITDSLWRRSLQNEAWIIALYGPTVELLAKQTGKTEEAIKAELNQRQKTAYQKLL